MGRYNLRDKTSVPTPQTPPSHSTSTVPTPAPKPKTVYDVADLPRSEIERLEQAADILRRLQRRSKNQHRRSPWWRHFNEFRRQLARLVGECAVILNGGETSGFQGQATKSKVQGQGESQVPGKRRREDTLRAVDAQAKRRQAVADTRVTVEKRVRFWEDHCVEDWWATFDELVGDSQYSAIGLVLLGAVAEVCDVVGITARLKGERGREVKTVVLGRQEGANAVEMRVNEEDVGVRIEREDSAPRKKRRKNRDAIDDLFSGLV